MLRLVADQLKVRVESWDDYGQREQTQSPVKPNSRHMLEHIKRLKAWQDDARRPGEVQDATALRHHGGARHRGHGHPRVIDKIIDLHDRILGKLFNAAKNKHQQQCQASGKEINAKVRLLGRIGQALIEAKQSGGDQFAAIEAVMS